MSPDEDRKLTVHGRVVVDGSARGEALVFTEPLSLWGGLDPVTGEVIDRRHPQVGARVTDRVWLLPRGRGSSSASSVLLEAVRLGTAPAALVLAEVDGILALGATVARELYDRSLPVVVIDQESFDQFRDGQSVTVEPGGIVVGLLAP